MASLPVFDGTGKEIGKYGIDPTEIAATINRQLLHDVVVMYQASARQGSHKTKSRAEVAGNKKKMYRQKGTGNARAGSRRSNIRRGGGHAFAKRNRRSYFGSADRYDGRFPGHGVVIRLERPRATCHSMAGRLGSRRHRTRDSERPPDLEASLDAP